MTLITVGEFEIEVIRKKIKNLHLYVLHPMGDLKVTAPFKMDNEVIKHFVLSKTEWIRKQKLKISSTVYKKPLEFVSGEKISILGKDYILKIIPGLSKNKIELSNEELFIFQSKSDKTDRIAQTIKDFYRTVLKDIVSALIEKWESSLGVKATFWNVKDMKTRWGTCNVQQKRIWLSLKLATKDLRHIEYVVVHELAHLIERNHSKKFYAILSNHIPDWKLLRRELNESR